MAARLLSLCVSASGRVVTRHISPWHSLMMSKCDLDPDLWSGCGTTTWRMVKLPAWPPYNFPAREITLVPLVCDGDRKKVSAKANTVTMKPLICLGAKNRLTYWQLASLLSLTLSQASTVSFGITREPLPTLTSFYHLSNFFPCTQSFKNLIFHSFAIVKGAAWDWVRCLSGAHTTDSGGYQWANP